jgi:2-polyprenyl-3-methyl-5-hydroxy-6-metoxy-1,4-benzoquinol methylase
MAAPALNAEIVPPNREAYDKWHEVFSTDPDANTPWYRLIKTHLRRGDLEGRRILEIGCGRGDFTCWLAREFGNTAEVCGADFSATAVRKAQAFAKSRQLRARWLVTDIQSIAAPSSNFDVVFCCETLEHVRDPRKAVAELVRVLKPGGRLFVSTPNYTGLMGLYRGYLRLVGRPYTEVGQPINHFTTLPRTIGWIRSAGLRITDVDAIGHYLPFPGRPPIEMSLLDNLRSLMRWTGLHSLVMAQK